MFFQFITSKLPCSFTRQTWSQILLEHVTKIMRAHEQLSEGNHLWCYVTCLWSCSRDDERHTDWSLFDFLQSTLRFHTILIKLQHPLQHTPGKSSCGYPLPGILLVLYGKHQGIIFPRWMQWAQYTTKAKKWAWTQLNWSKKRSQHVVVLLIPAVKIINESRTYLDFRVLTVVYRFDDAFVFSSDVNECVKW